MTNNYNIFQLTLAVIGLPSGLIYIFDLITCPAIMSQGMLANLIISKEIIKVLFFINDIDYNGLMY